MSTSRVVVQQKLWGEKVVVHLFLAGLAAGMYIIGSLLDLFNVDSGFTRAAQLSTGSAIPIVLVGLIFLFSHLGQTANALNALRKPGSSWLARGSIALLIFLVLDMVQCFFWIWPYSFLGMLPGLNAVLQVINSIIALFILLYSGMLLADLRTFPFWRNWSLPFLFVASGLTSGLMFLILIATLLGNLSGNFIITLMSSNSILILVLALALTAFLWRGNKEANIRDSVYIMTGVHSRAFYLGILISGILLPGLLSVYIIYSTSSQVIIFILSLVLTILGLIGSYLLKSLVLKSGTSSNLRLKEEVVPLQDAARIPASQRVKYH